jgi:hypothetical protein
MTETYSLGDDGKQLIIRRYYSPDISSDTGKELHELVFDRM